MGQQADRCYPGLHCALESERPPLNSHDSVGRRSGPSRAQSDRGVTWQFDHLRNSERA